MISRWAVEREDSLMKQILGFLLGFVGAPLLLVVLIYLLLKILV